MVAPPMLMPVPGTGRGHLNLATSIRSLRLRSGLSQRQLAGRMAVPRTYVSKIENEKATPTLSSAGTAGACTGGHCARTAQRRRTQPSGRNQRVDERSIYRRTLAVCFATKWDADVEHPDSGAGLDGTAEKKRVRKTVSSFRFRVWWLRIRLRDRSKPETSKLGDRLYPGNQPTLAGTDLGPGFFRVRKLRNFRFRSPHLNLYLRFLCLEDLCLHHKKALLSLGPPAESGGLLWRE